MGNIIKLQTKIDFTFKGVSLQIQPDEKTCGHTCIAMVLGIPVGEVIASFPPDKRQGMNWEMVEEKLDENNIFNSGQHKSITYTGWNIISVPSLNVQHGKHMVLIHVGNAWGGDITVFDPAPLYANRHCVDGSTIGQIYNWCMWCIPKNADTTGERIIKILDKAAF